MAFQKNILKRQQSVKEEPELHEMTVYIDGKEVKQGDLVSPPSFVVNDVDDDMCLLKDDIDLDADQLPSYDEVTKTHTRPNSSHNSPSRYKDDLSDSVALCDSELHTSAILNKLDKSPKFPRPVRSQSPNLRRLQETMRTKESPVNLKTLQEVMRTKDSITSIGKNSVHSLTLSRENSRCSQRSFISSTFGSRKPSDDGSVVESLTRNSFDNESYSLNFDDSMEITSVASTPRQMSLDYSCNFSPQTPKTFRPTASPVPHPFRVRAPPRTARTLEERFRDEMRNCIIEQTEQINSAEAEQKETGFCEPKVILVMCTIIGGLFIIIGAVLFSLSQSTLKFHGGAGPGKALLIIGFLMVGGVAVVLYMHYKKTNSSESEGGTQITVQQTVPTAQAAES